MCVRRIVRKDCDLGRARDGIDRDMAVDRALCERDIDVARARDLVDLGDRLGSVGHRGDCLRAADLEDRVDARFLCGDECRRIDLAVSARRRAHDDFIDARDLRRNDIHEDRGRIRRLAARDIDTGPVERRDALAEDHAVLLCHEPALLSLVLMEGADSLDRPLDDADKLRIDELVRLFLFLRCHADVVRRKLAVIELFLVLEDGLVAVFLYIFKNLRDSRLLLRIAVRAPLKE